MNEKNFEKINAKIVIQLIRRTSDFGNIFSQKNMKMFENINVKIIISYMLCQISVNLDNFRYLDQICSKKYE